ncbi:MAG: bifunctional DNA-formamidopyrimidine glycosylase/DNA-(apurinic or apyrimidinic site) lyase [Actinomycetota bacterium]
MPELPEVETIRRDLDKEVVGKKIKSVDVETMRAVRRHPNKKNFAERLEGAKVTGLRRRGKWLLFSLDSDDVLVAHLGMSGQLRRHANKDEMAKHTHVVITFTQKGQLRFVDPRTFGELFITDAEELEKEVTELRDLGFDPVDTPMSWTAFAEKLYERSVKLKPLLMDQKFIAGIGNIYSDEILFQAGLRHDRLSNTLSTQELRRLYRAVVETLHDAIKYGGSTLSDGGYVNAHGEPGSYQEHHEVYDREGEPCRRCRAPIQKMKISKRSHYYCEQCQV